MNENEPVSLEDYFNGTFVEWQLLPKEEVPEREPDFVSGSGSKYWHIDNAKIIRQSDHWGYCTDCVWILPGAIKNTTQTAVAFLNTFKKVEQSFKKISAEDFEIGEEVKEIFIFPMLGKIEEATFSVCLTKKQKKTFKNKANPSHLVPFLLIYS